MSKDKSKRRAADKGKASSPPQRRPTPSRLAEIVLVLLFCCAFLFLSRSFTRSACGTYDEMVHLASGYACLHGHDYRISPTHPPLAKKFAAIPLLWQHVWPETITPTEDDFSYSKFFDSQRLLHLFWINSLKYPSLEWSFSHELFYGIRREAQERFAARTPLLIPTTATLTKSDFHNDPENLLGAGRLAMLSLTLGLAILIYIWSRQIHQSIAAGILSLALFVFDPNFIAHGSLVTTDVPFALFFFSAIYFYWRLSRGLTMPCLLLFALSFGAAFATKFSAVLLIPIFCLIAFVRIFAKSGSPASWSKTQSLRASVVTQLLLFAFAGCVSFCLVWAAYDFRYSAAADPVLAARQEEQADKTIKIQNPTASSRPGYFPVELEVRRASAVRALFEKYEPAKVTEKLIADSTALVPPGRIGRLIIFLNDHKVLPEGFLEGLAGLRSNSLLTASYLRGDYSLTGFRSYFFWTFLYKTTLPAIAAILLGIALAFYRKMLWSRDLAFLVVPVAIAILALIPAHMNIGHRHLLLVYPFLYVPAGGIANEVQRRTRARWPLVVAIGLIAISSSFVFYPPWRPQIIFPHYLAYFNELAGGPTNGWRSLADSNIDWGQDLKGLKQWLDRNNIHDPIYLSYFGTADPRYYQIVHKPVPVALGAYALATVQNEDAFEQTRRFQLGLQSGDYIAISAHNILGVRLSTGARQIWQHILNRCTLIDRVGYSIFIYKVN